jgi:hypothetical protein
MQAGRVMGDACNGISAGVDSGGTSLIIVFS